MYDVWTERGGGPPPSEQVPMIPKDLIPTVAARFKALGDPGRLAILAALRDGERSVSELVEATGRSQPNVSQHVGALARVGFVAGRREGNRVYYRIADTYVEKICEAVCDGLAERVRREGQALRSRRQA
jgi:DNA-binding transcriptional ArsR family regulator